MTIFGERLNRLLNRKGISQTELAEMVDTTASNISRYISTDREPRAEIALHIADALGTTVDYLFGRTNNPHNEVSAAAMIDAPDGYDSLTDDQKEQIQNLIDMLNEGNK